MRPCDLCERRTDEKNNRDDRDDDVVASTSLNLTVVHLLFRDELALTLPLFAIVCCHPALFRTLTFGRNRPNHSHHYMKAMPPRLRCPRSEAGRVGSGT